MISSIQFKPCACEQSDHRLPGEGRAENRGGEKACDEWSQDTGQEEVKL